ncbi:class I SAM-dependent methyltransferase [Cyclobacterium jeungdonense]|uniref:Methyltransferase domain-containing protein n=1 Tax=Cyclobacterium jeungdonense TaxID=708087 RepID=A0ABT8CFX9_9BACT|nr:methyltransferase domain-containing protein [Cyclobacterium jeungdonense]MDN3690585.1 methyltransferase domain-containing protein [Cyclobacterium jeungdonense]
MRIKNKIKSILNYKLLRFSKKLFYNYQCPVCENYIRYFIPLPKEYYEKEVKYNFRYKLDQLETLNHSKYRCPICYCNDRDRMYTLYLKRFFKSFGNRVFKLVDFGPSMGFSKWLKDQKNIDYRSADLFKEDVDDKVDISDMKLYREGQFDIFICSHILEHVIDPKKALDELYRITSKGGWGIIMVPMVIGLNKTQEDPSYNTDEERWKYYFQNDHLRLFGKVDFLKNIQQAGFSVNQLGIDFFGEKRFRISAISKSSVLYIATKK